MCEHLESYKRGKGLESYAVLHAYFVSAISKDSSKRKTLETTCNVCQQFGYKARIHACMSCVFFGCFKKDMKTHASKEMHEIAMSLFTGDIYCFKCQDYVYDDDFSSVAKKQGWRPSKEEIELFKKHKRIQSVGLRGIVNLGFTCYMNCVIQVFAHTPMMRNYFLSDRHRCYREKSNCQACHCSYLFQELYSGKKEPFYIPHFVYDLWKNHKVFFGNDAKDAHEFYELYLDDLHESCKENAQSRPSLIGHSPTRSPEPAQGFQGGQSSADPHRIANGLEKFDSLPCRCVVHQIFSGVIDRCTSCTEKCSVPKIESSPFWTVGLVLGVGAKEGTNGVKENNLPNCIKRFLQIEETNLQIKETNLKMEKDEEIVKKKCKKCEMGNETNQNIFKVLPNILCFQMLHEKTKNGKIINIHVVFPEHLDMSVYTPETARSEMRQEKKTGKKHTSKKNLYTLYATVCHIGEDGGHYFTYVRKGRGIWYLCDDEKIKKVDIEEVLKCEGFKVKLLFYIKENLEYE